MLKDRTRKIFIDSIVQKLRSKAKKEIDILGLQEFRYSTSLCTVMVTAFEDNSAPPTVIITEHFGDTLLMPALPDSYQRYDGVRKSYTGSYDGLNRLELEVLYLPNEKGDFSTPQIIEIRSEKKLFDSDKERYDSYIHYLFRHL